MLTRESMCHDSNSVCGVDALDPVFLEAKHDSGKNSPPAPLGSVAMGGRCVSLSKIISSVGVVFGINGSRVSWGLGFLHISGIYRQKSLAEHKGHAKKRVIVLMLCIFGGTAPPSK